ncbi:hypothetical protein QYF61_005738 [Mycteria americana]|uniref:Uncharacterized protein n=1 Tax=Mycteria americana TaxID=33587 RepID=A0AAN7P463_MYCAM|nr:hypothetical protein QYF61_005738 [Mycteria americana]
MNIITAKSSPLRPLGSIVVSDWKLRLHCWGRHREVDLSVPTGLLSPLQRQHCGFTTYPRLPWLAELQPTSTEQPGNVPATCRGCANACPTFSVLEVRRSSSRRAWSREKGNLCETQLSRNKKGWRLNHFPGQPVPRLDNPFSEDIFPNIQSKPPLAQVEAISSHPITCYLGDKTDPHLSTTSFQAKQPQFPQPLLIRLLLQTLHQLRCPSLDTLQHLNVSLVVRGPKLNTVFEPSDHFCVPPLDPLQQVHVFPVLRAPELDAVLQLYIHHIRTANICPLLRVWFGASA